MACEDLNLLNILSIFRTIINIMMIVIPAILVLFVIIDIVKTTSSGDVDTKKLGKAISKRVIAAVMIFMIPLIINLVLGFFTDKSYYLNCYNNANKQYITDTAKSLADAEIIEATKICVASPNLNSFEKARVAVKKIPDKKTREDYKSKIDTLRSLCTPTKDEANNSGGGSSNPTPPAVAKATIWVGDSRVLGICQAKSMCGSGKTCYNDKCIAATGEDYSWFNNTAIDKIKSVISSHPNTDYTVYVNIGVNGVGSTGTNAGNFSSALQRLVQKDLPTTKFVFISVNPVTDGESNATNAGVNKFNESIKKSINNFNSSNLKYCETNSTVKPVPSSDGLHYSSTTNKSIYDYVISHC